MYISKVFFICLLVVTKLIHTTFFRGVKCIKINSALQYNIENLISPYFIMNKMSVAIHKYAKSNIRTYSILL